MKHVSSLVLFLGVALVSPLQAADPVPAQVQTQTTRQTQIQERDRIYGYELMTRQERMEYRERMRALKTEQERMAFRQQHHKDMQERARTQGKTLPDMPPEGRGPGMGPGMGSGMGPGSRR